MPQNLRASDHIPLVELLAPSAAMSTITSLQLHDKFHLLVELSTNIAGVLLYIKNTPAHCWIAVNIMLLSYKLKM